MKANSDKLGDWYAEEIGAGYKAKAWYFNGREWVRKARYDDTMTKLMGVLKYQSSQGSKGKNK